MNETEDWDGSAQTKVMSNTEPPKKQPEVTSVDVFSEIALDGRHELKRPVQSLWWSGIVAGAAMSLSAVGEAAIIAHLPDAEWQPLISSFGYCLGFLIVILGRLQLFTENTITPVLTILPRVSTDGLGKLARLWVIVFAANFIGVTLAMLFFSWAPALPDPIMAALNDLSIKAVSPPPTQVFATGIVAGFMIAALVWGMTGSPGSAFIQIVVITYSMALFDLAHIIAGAGEALFLVINGERAFFDMLTGYLLPALGGNVAGGTLLFAFIAYAQISEEIR